MERITNAAVIAAHPDDETLWAGGLMMRNHTWNWHVASLCRGSDEDRAPRFRRALEALGAEGGMGDLDDGPDQAPLQEDTVQQAILSLLPQIRYDLVLTHDPLAGEYTRHRRHEETGKGVIGLWTSGKLDARHLWTFAYADGGGKRLPRAVKQADYSFRLPVKDWERKYKIITAIYGFDQKSFEARTAPRREAFRCFNNPAEAQRYLEGGHPRGL